MSEGYLTQLDKEFTKEFGEGVFTDATKILEERRHIIPVSPRLDVGLSGGVPEGSWLSIAGPPKTGKTTLALQIAAEAQKPEHGSRIVVYLKVEGRFNKKNVSGIRGLNLDQDSFRIVESTPDKVLIGSDFLNIAVKVIQTIPQVTLIVDSISALLEAKTAEDGVGVQTRGGRGRLISDFVTKLNQIVPLQRSLVIGIAHVYANTSGYGEAWSEKSGSEWKYQADTRLRVKSTKPWEGAAAKESKGPKIGSIVSWEVQESALGAPGAVVESYLRYGTGIDKLYELIEQAKDLGMVEVKGSWMSAELGGETIKSQGQEKFYKHLLDNPKAAVALEQGVRSALYGASS